MLIVKLLKKVICLNTGEVFVSGSEAAAKYGLHRNSVNRACNPNGSAKTAGKDPMTNERLKWMYYDEYLAKSNGEEYVYEAKSAPLRKQTKKVICLNTKEVFESTVEAAKSYGLKFASGISKACKEGCYTGKHPETKEKLKWMYYEDYLALQGDDNNE